MFVWGYNTNGTSDHPLEQAIAILGDLGYRSVAITLDHHALNPFSTGLHRELRRIERILRQFGMSSFVETGARYLLDPIHKHEPTLVSADPAGRHRRCDFLTRALEIAQDVGSQGVSFWSGARSARDPRDAQDVATDFRCHLECLLGIAERKGVPLAIEAEPGMFLERNCQARELVQALNSPFLGLTLDVGHLHCLNEPWEEITRSGSALKNVHLEDMHRGEHLHRPLGEGEIDFPQVWRKLREIDYCGPIHVELSRHAHAFPEMARQSLDFLRACTV